MNKLMDAGYADAIKYNKEMSAFDMHEKEDDYVVGYILGRANVEAADAGYEKAHEDAIDRLCKKYCFNKEKVMQHVDYGE